MSKFLIEINKLSTIFNKSFRKQFCTAKLLNASPTVEPVNLSYKLYTTTDSDNGVPPLIVMHGLFGAKRNWHSFCQNLQKSLTPRRKIIVVDTRNHGDSPHSPYHTYAHLAQDIIQLLKHLNIDTTAVLGHSAGGRTMMFLALSFPHLVDRAIIVDISPTNDHPSSFDGIRNALRAMRSTELPPEISAAEGRRMAHDYLQKELKSTFTPDFLLQNLYKLDNGNFAWKLNISGLEANIENMLLFPEDMYSKQFRGPMFFICGSKANFVHSSDMSLIKQLFPNAQLSWIDSGHLIHLERPAELISMVSTFLAQN